MTRPICALLFVLTGCVVTESGNPPIIDTDLVVPLGSIGDQFVLAAMRAVDPPGGEIFLVNLTRGGIDASPVDAEGSFASQIGYELGDSFRLQVVGEDGQRSAPYDFRTTTGDDRLPLDDGLSCVLVVVAPGSAMVSNECAEAQMLAARFATGREVTPLGFVLGVGESREVTFDAAITFDVLVLEEAAGLLQGITLP